MEKRKILVVDDCELDAKMLAAKLEVRWFDVSIVYDGKSCLESIENEKFDIILLDIMMPVMTGFDVLKEIRKVHASIVLPVIMVTGKEDVSDVVNALKMGANDYIMKPANIDIVCARVKTQLDIADFHMKDLKRQETEALNALIVSCAHEINNPLAVAICNLEKELKGKRSKRLEEMELSLDRISEIVKKICHITQDDIEYTDYDKDTKMIKLK